MFRFPIIKMHKEYIKATSILLSGVLFFGACGKQAPEEEEIVVEQSDESTTYRVFAVEVGDVIKTEKISVSYKQSAEQEVSFSLAGRMVDKVYVNEGDTVKKGDLLAELSADDLEKQIADLEYSINKTQTLLKYLDLEEENAKTEAELNAQARALGHASNEDIQKARESAGKKYDRQRQDYNDSLEFDMMKLNKLKSELSGSRLRAGISGTVRRLKKNLEGSTSHKDEVIMTILDGTGGMFEAKSAEYADLLSGSESFTVNIAYGDAKGDYIVSPSEPDKWTDSQLFEIVAGPEDAQLEVGSIGTLVLTLESRSSVLRIPNQAIHQADDKFYVYMSDDEGMRVVKWIEVGVIGDDYTEIISGLSEKDQVLR